MHTVHVFYTEFMLVASFATEKEAMAYFAGVCQHLDCQTAVIAFNGQYINGYQRP